MGTDTQMLLHMRLQHVHRDEAKRWNIRADNEIYIEDIKPLKQFSEHSSMIYQGQNETFAAHYDSSSFMALIIASCSKQTQMRLHLLGWDNKQSFWKYGAKMEMNDPMDVNKHHWSSSFLSFYFLTCIQLNCSGSVSRCWLYWGEDTSLQTDLSLLCWL